MRMFVNRLGEMVNFELSKERKKDFFVLSRAWDKEKNSESPWRIKPLPSSELAISLIILLILVDAGRVSYEFRNRPRSLWSLCGSVTRNPKGTQNFLFVPRSWKTKKSVFFLYLCMFKHKIIIIMIRLQLIIVTNTLAHREKDFFFHGVVTFDVKNDISTVYCESSSGDKVDRVLLK